MMNICALSESVIAKQSDGILFGIINTDKFFQCTERDMGSFPSYSQPNSILLLSLFLLLLFIVIALTDTGTILEFNVTNR